MLVGNRQDPDGANTGPRGESAGGWAEVGVDVPEGVL